MTVKTNNDLVTVTYTNERGKTAELTVKVTEVTQLTDALLAARKEAYENVRTEKAAERAARKAEREAKKAERDEKSAVRKADQIAKLEARLAKLQG
jgi:hypothetical protein